jgi:alpha-1,2-mannosyltransferase
MALTLARARRLPGLRAFESPGFRVVCAGLVCLGAAAGMALNALGALANYAGEADIHTLLVTTRRFWSGASTYLIPPAGAPDRFLTGPTSEPYPPTTFIALWPFSVMPETLARLLWLGLELGALALLVALVWRGIGRPSRAEGLLAAALVLTFLPVRETVFEGQFGIFLTLLTVAAALAWERGRAGLAGALLAAAIAIKLTPALLLLYLLGRGLWRVVAATLGWLALVILAGFPLAGRWVHYLDLMQAIGRGTAFAGNQSLPGVVLRLFRPDLSGQPIPPPPAAVSALSVAAELGVLVALAAVVDAAVRRWRHRVLTVHHPEPEVRRLAAWTELGLVLTVLPLIQPFAWFHHWASAVPAILVAARLARLGRLRTGPAVGLAVAYALALATYPTYHLVRNVPGPELAGHPLQLALSCVFFAAVVVASVALARALLDLLSWPRAVA